MLHPHLVFHVQKRIMKCKVLCFIVRHKKKFQRIYCYFGDAIVCPAFSILKHGNKIRLIKGY